MLFPIASIASERLTDNFIESEEVVSAWSLLGSVFVSITRVPATRLPRH